MQNRILILATSSALTLRGGFWTEGYDPLTFEPHWHDTNLVLVNAGLPHGPQEPGFRLTVMTPRTAKIRGSPDDRRTTRDSTDSAAPPDDRSAEVGTSLFMGAEREGRAGVQHWKDVVKLQRCVGF